MKIHRRVFHEITNVNKKNIKLTIHRSSHRKKLVRWLYEVVKDFKYSQVTFALSINLLDSYTQKNGFEISDYQLIGITSLFIAAKLEENKLKSIEEYVKVTDNFVSVEEIIKMERIITLNVNFDFKIPHLYLKMWYLNKMSDSFSLTERQEILFAIFAFMLETSSIRNSYYMYLEGIREAEKIMSGLGISKEQMFYIKNNNVTNRINFKNVIKK